MLTLERHFDLVQAQHEIATPQAVFTAYKMPRRGVKAKEEKIRNLAFSESLDKLIGEYLGYHSKYTDAHKHGRIPAEPRKELLEREKKRLDLAIEKMAKEATAIFDDKSWTKTLMLAVDEHLLHFLQLAAVGHRSPNTLEKMFGRKRRYIEFLEYRYKAIDIPLHQLEFRFLDQLKNFCMVQKRVIENTAMKFAQCIKEIIDRCVSNGWMTANIFTSFTCTYTDPHHDWLTMNELGKLLDTEFENPKLNVIRDIFIFSSFTGLSYQEIYTLGPADIITGIDGKKWVNKSRQKTDGDETLPLLPLPLDLIDKYKNHPVCIARNKLFPVPTNPEYNRCLKVIADLSGIKIVLRTHKARFFFANEIAYNNGVPLKTIGRMLGQKSVKSTEIYVRANRTAISESMETVEQKLFNEDGSLKSGKKTPQAMGKVVPLKSVR